MQRNKKIIKRNSRIIKRNSRIIKRNPPMIIEIPKKNLGGYLPDPPEYCERPDFWIYCFNRYWIDLSLCHPCPNITKCDRRAEYLKALKINRQNTLIKKKGKEND